MRLLHYQTDGGPRLAVESDGQVRDAGLELEDVFAGQTPRPTGDALDVERLRMAPSVLRPGKIICIGLNYRRHAAESGMPVPADADHLLEASQHARGVR